MNSIFNEVPVQPVNGSPLDISVPPAMTVPPMNAAVPPDMMAPLSSNISPPPMNIVRSSSSSGDLYDTTGKAIVIGSTYTCEAGFSRRKSTFKVDNIDMKKKRIGGEGIDGKKYRQIAPSTCRLEGDTSPPQILDELGQQMIMGSLYKCKSAIGSSKTFKLDTIDAKRKIVGGEGSDGKKYRGFQASKCTPATDIEMGKNVGIAAVPMNTNTDALFSPLISSLNGIIALQGGSDSTPRLSMMGGQTKKKGRKLGLLKMGGPMHREADVKRNINICIDLSKRIMSGVTSSTAASAIAADATATAAEAAAVAAAPLNASPMNAAPMNIQPVQSNSPTLFGGRRRRRTHRRRRS